MWKRWVEVRREERRAVLVAFVTLFAIVCGHSVLETARDALFLAKIPASRLPIAYFAIAVLIVLVGQLTSFLRRWVARAALLPGALAACAVCTGLFWSAIDGANNALLYTLYVWSGLVGTFVVGLFWIRVGDMFDVGQAKRLFPLIGIGGVAGATAGSLLARSLLASFESRHLILAAVCTYLFAAAWVAWSWTLSAPDRIESAYDQRSVSMTRFEILRREPYLRRLSILIALSMVTVTVVDYLFKSAVAAEVPAEQLGEFFATYYSIVNGLSAVVQVVVAPILLSYLGVNRALILFPVMLLAAGFGLLVTGSMTAGLILKGVDGTLRHSLYRTGMEILYLPLSADIRGRFKALLDGFAQRGGQAVASLAILSVSMSGFGQEQLATGVLILAVLWIALGFQMRSGYLDLFRERLLLGHIDARVDVPDLDLSALEQLLEALNSS
ncbi:MAG: Npt1/Npt2 family nucleotide transporter, partial [Myxococcota bacterium]